MFATVIVSIVIITLVVIIEAIIFKYIIVINYCKCSNVIICTHNPYYWFIFKVLET